MENVEHSCAFQTESVRQTVKSGNNLLVNILKCARPLRLTRFCLDIVVLARVRARAKLPGPSLRVRRLIGWMCGSFLRDCAPEK